MNNVLIIEPHCDDAVLGAFVPLMYGKSVTLVTATDSGAKRREENDQFLKYLNEHRRTVGLGPINQHLLMFDDGYAGKDIPMLAASISESVQSLEGSSNPLEWDVVYIPEPSLHQDHQDVYRASLIALRTCKSKILSYEYPEASNQFYHTQPNVYAPMVESDVSIKIDLMMIYQSQQHDLRNGNAIKSLASIRGMAIGKEYAEAYTLVREVL